MDGKWEVVGGGGKDRSRKAYDSKDLRRDLLRGTSSSAANAAVQPVHTHDSRPAKKKLVNTPVTLEQALNSVSLSDLISLYEHDTATYENRPSLCLINLTTQFCSKLSAVPEPDPCFSGKPYGELRS